ncbi:MAG: SusE domain-containing protein [Prevotella sp.]
MKTKIFRVLLLMVCAIPFVSCTEEMEWKDSAVSAPSGLMAPEDNKAVTLQSSATASLVFEWGISQSEDGGAPMYEVVFDKEGGDFSEPLYKVAADLGGSLNKATVLHKTLNRIAGMAGAASGETANVQWTVFAYRGLNKAVAAETRHLKLTRFFGFDELPGALYVINSAEDSPVACGSPANGEFEVFVKLDAGKKFYFNSKADGKGTSYSIQDDKVIEGDKGFSVSESGVYRMYMDFNVASLTKLIKVEKVVLYFCPDDAETIEMPYVGQGVFSGTGVVSFKQEGWGRDQRYKFHMYYGDGSMQVWGTKNNTDSTPNGADLSDPYYYIAETPNNQWDQKWKFDNKFDGGEDGPTPGVKTKLSMIFNVANYTHHVELP